MVKRRAKSGATVRSAARATVESLEARIVISGTIVLGQQAGAPNNTEFHGDGPRTGFNQNETVLTQSNVASSFGQIWESPVFDGHVYATPLYADSIAISGNIAASAGQNGIQSSSFAGKSLGIVFAATGGGTVYAVAAQDTNGASGIAPGTIVWQEHLGNAYAGIDGNSIGVLGSPVIDLKAQRLYVCGSVTFNGQSDFWVFALNLRDGSIVSGWPLEYTQALLDSINTNTLVSGTGPELAVQFSESGADQRGALNLSPDGSTLYVDYACYGSSNPGWMTTVATGVTNGVTNNQTPAIVGAFSDVDNASTSQNGGMWGAGGPAIDANGNVFVTTGDSPGGTGNPVGDFSNSVLEFGPGQILHLTGLYTPWNWPTQDTIDSDMGGGSPIILNLPAGSSTTTELLATGGKQGNGYLADAGNNLNNPTNNPHSSPASYPASLIQRPPNNLTPDQDASLYDTTPTGIRSYWVSPNGPQDGPLAVFGPYNESSASGDTAKARDTPATFTDASGNQYVIFAGTSKAAVGSTTPVAPSMVVAEVMHSAGNPAYLQIVAQNKAVFSNAGSNLITGNGTANEIDWVVDSGALRTATLTTFSAAGGDPVLYAYDAVTMQPLWSSAYQELDMGGKYNSLAVARGDVFLGTDRIQAFGLTGNTIVDDAVTGTGTNQFNYHGTGWTHITGDSTMGTFDSTLSTDNVQGDSATLSFTGSAIKVYSNEDGFGTVTLQIDGGSTQTVSLSATPTSPNGLGEGDIPIFTFSGLSAGTHTLTILNNAASNTIAIDRVEIVPNASTSSKIGVSVTDGEQIPSGSGAVIPYTVNWNNQGSILNGYGTNATGVTVTETVPVNTTADLANSTSGWTPQIVGTGGPGSAGSTYTYSVGSVLAGTAGSAVFSVDLNSNIPVGTTTITDNVSISDAANDSGTGSHITPIPPPAESRLIFNVEPPTSGGANIALSPAPQVTIQDQFGNTFTSDSSSTVTLTLNTGTFSTGLTTATATASNGIATFPNLVFLNAGTYTFTASDGALTTTVSSSVMIAATSKLAITGQPTTATAGSPMGDITVAVESQSGVVITSDTSTVTLTLNTGHFSNGSTSASMQAVMGVATFSGDLTIDATGSYTLVATDGALISAQTNPITVSASASKLVFTQQPNNTYLGEAINPSVSVALEDQFGNIATADTSNVTLTLSGGATFFGGSTTETVAAGSFNGLNSISTSGVALFNNLVVTSTGTFTVTATDGSLTSATSSAFTIGTKALTTIDDNNNNNASGNQINYSPSGNWIQTATSLANNFDGTITTDSAGVGDMATVSFNGTLVTVYAATSTNPSSSAQFFVDGGSSGNGNVSLYSPTPSIVPIYTSPVLMTGSHTIEVEANGGSVSIDKFVVGPATPAIVWSHPVPISYGSLLAGTQLDAFISSYAGFSGSFVYNPPIGTKLAAGNQTLTTTFTPTDTTDYDTPASVSVPLTVLMTTPTITWSGPFTDLTYGQGLSSIQLNATATLNGVTVPGNFVYTPTFGFVPPAGENYPLSLTFTPTDTADFNSVTVQSDVDVDPATPVITWPTPTDISDGTAPVEDPTGQLNATATISGNTIPGTFLYTPAAGTVLPAGQHQALGVVFTPTDTNSYNVVGATDFINVNYGPAAKLAFTQQPNSIKSGGTVTPAVTVAIEDSAGSTIPTDTSTVTLTLSSGTFTNGLTTVTATAVNGVATFSSLNITTDGTYTLKATDTDNSVVLTLATSAPFNVGSSVFVSFNNAATDFTSNFTQNSNGTPGGNAFAWNATAGIDDQTGGTTPGGGVQVVGTNDQTSIYTASTINLSDGNVHTISEFVNAASGLSAGDKFLQLGFISSSTSGFNGGGGITSDFISVRIYGDYHSEVQTSHSGVTSTQDGTGVPTGIAANDWLQLILTTKETASGSYSGTYSIEDFGQTADPLTAVPTTIVPPTAYSVTGLTVMGTGAAVYAGWRGAITNIGSTPIKYDNFSVDDIPAHVLYLAQPTSGTAGVPLSSPFIAAVEDINNYAIAGDSSTVTLTLTHGTFSNGLTSVSQVAVNGITSFSNLTFSTPGNYELIASDPNANSDIGFALFTINGPAKLAFSQPPTGGSTGTPLSPTVTVAVQDTNGVTVASDTSTVTLTLSSGTFANTGTNTMAVAAVNGVATFTGLQINAVGTYTITASDTDNSVVLTPVTSSSFQISAGPAKLGFIQQPGPTGSGAIMTPLTVGILDMNGNVVTANTSTVTLTLSSGTFVNTGTNTMAVAAVSGVATFNNISITAIGSYTIAATDGTLTSATSNVFAITNNPKPFYINFNNGSGDFSNNFTVYNDPPAANNTSLNWGATAGIADQSGGSGNGGGITSTGTVVVDSTAVDNTNSVNLADNQVHTLSEYVTDNMTPGGAGDKILQLGVLAAGSTNFDSNFNGNPSGFSFLSARILGNNTAEVQYCNSSTITSIGNTALTGVTVGDWLQLVFTVQQSSAGNFSGTFAVVDYGSTGEKAGFYALTPTAWTVTGVTGMGTGANLLAGFRSQTASFTGTLAFDNFSVDPAVTTIDDAVTAGTTNKISYSGGTHWVTTGSLSSNYDHTIHTDTTAGESATVTFNGSQIIYYAETKSTFGNATVSIDGGTATTVSLTSASTVGSVPVYETPILTPGQHTLKITVGSSAGISIDRFDIIKATPIMVWAPPAAISYGTALGFTQLDSTAPNLVGSGSLAGTFVYTQPNGTVLPGGVNQSLGVTFIPTDLTDYATTSDSTSINVIPALVSSQVAGGAVQRSDVQSFSITFNEAVNFSTSSFTLYQGTLSSGTVTGYTNNVSAGVTATSTDNITWTFTVNAGGILDRGGETGATFLANGVYQLVLNNANITDKATGLAAVGTGTQIVSFANSNTTQHPSGMAPAFHALYGDINGDQAVNNTDLTLFKKAITASGGTYVAAFDYNNDGLINNTDITRIKQTFLTLYTY